LKGKCESYNKGREAKRNIYLLSNILHIDIPNMKQNVTMYSQFY